MPSSSNQLEQTIENTVVVFPLRGSIKQDPPRGGWFTIKFSALELFSDVKKYITSNRQYWMSGFAVNKVFVPVKLLVLIPVIDI